MRKIEKPNNNIAEILDNAIKHLNSPRKEHIENARGIIEEKTNEYDVLGQRGELHTIQIHNNVEELADKEDMEALYTQKMVPKDSPNRYIYDSIMFLAPFQKCPYCQQNLVKTLDHYLPKSKFVTYSVSPYNLVPSCTDCNVDKRAKTYDKSETQLFHPYYDDFDDTVWLKAIIVEKIPISFQFYADPESSVPEEKAKRIIHSFSPDGYNLNEIYTLHSAEKFYECFPRIQELFRKGGRQLAEERLNEYIEDATNISNNSWQAAMYRAMIESDWFWNVYIVGNFY